MGAQRPIDHTKTMRERRSYDIYPVVAGASGTDDNQDDRVNDDARKMKKSRMPK